MQGLIPCPECNDRTHSKDLLNFQNDIHCLKVFSSKINPTGKLQDLDSISRVCSRLGMGEKRQNLNNVLSEQDRFCKHFFYSHKPIFTKKNPSFCTEMNQWSRQ